MLRMNDSIRRTAILFLVGLSALWTRTGFGQEVPFRYSSDEQEKQHELTREQAAQQERIQMKSAMEEQQRRLQENGAEVYRSAPPRQNAEFAAEIETQAGGNMTAVSKQIEYLDQLYRQEIQVLQGLMTEIAPAQRGQVQFALRNAQQMQARNQHLLSTMERTAMPSAPQDVIRQAQPLEQLENGAPAYPPGVDPTQTFMGRQNAAADGTWQNDRVPNPRRAAQSLRKQNSRAVQRAD